MIFTSGGRKVHCTTRYLWVQRRLRPLRMISPPKCKKRALENTKRAPENRHRLQCKKPVQCCRFSQWGVKSSPRKKKKNVFLLLFFASFFLFFLPLVQRYPGPGFIKGWYLGLSLLSPSYHPTVSQWCLIPEVVWYLEKTPPDMWYLYHPTTPSSAENEELILSSRTQNYATIPGGAHFREDTAIPSKMNSLHFCHFLLILCIPPFHFVS